MLNTIRYSFAVSAKPPQILPAGTVEDAGLRTLLSYWESMRGKELLPQRATPSSLIARLLKFTHLSEVLEGGEDFRFRIVGMGVFPGQPSQKGRLVSQHPDMGVRVRFPILMRAAVSAKTPVRGVAQREMETGCYRVESIWLPFGDAEVRQIMGMGVFRQIKA